MGPLRKGRGKLVSAAAHFVVLPHLPDNMQALYNQFSAVLNGGHPPLERFA